MPTYHSHIGLMLFKHLLNLINRQPTPLLNNKSPFENLFNQPPNYLKLRQFGCLCFPLTRPYNTHKLQPKASPCIFLGYSQTQSAYRCMDLQTKKIYLSRHVLFHEKQKPFSSSLAAPLENFSALSPLPIAPTSNAATTTSANGRCTCFHSTFNIASSH
ncbi:hypothetical protein Patl1_04241 [Pistacia atlantica]|uniref:Uncharacterized protein n=1 Tax=Pistacia atlantica TaxID=434234 RepID=A0ACC1BPR1_9ROSI|nr:hypothetical protein Patl1_04241 [Pistacia atlantica]